MLKPSTLHKLKSGKNLLAFSAGGDSTALLFLLLKNNITFDIAIVDYGIRSQSKDEVKYAKKLAQQYNFHCFVLTAQKIESNFEANARAIRYEFFENLIKEHTFENLLTAHHLGDRFEWMLMQFCKGAGCIELAGMQASQKYNHYTLLRPLLHVDKSELVEFLQTENIYYFEDESNSNPKYKRNKFRHTHTKPLLEKYLKGIKKSFEYIDADVNELIQDINIQHINDFAYFHSSGEKRSDIFHIDKYLKQKGFLISSNEKKLLKSQKTVVIARKIVINQEHGFVFIMPFIRDEKMDKNFKEEMRILRIDPKIRMYLFKNPQVKKLLISLV